MPELPSKSRLNTLGKRLAAGQLSPGERDELAAARAHWYHVLGALNQVINDTLAPLGLTATGRLKNLGTIAEKIRRDSTALARMRDVIGCRVVVTRGRTQQLEVVELLEGAFSDARPARIDRNADPRYGYRAIHLELDYSGVRAEIQVRTERQHQWAQLVEDIADRFGRPLRYGDRSVLDDHPAEVAHTVHDVLDMLAEIADTLAELEDVEHHWQSHLRWHDETWPTTFRAALVSRSARRIWSVLMSLPSVQKNRREHADLGRRMNRVHEDLDRSLRELRRRLEHLS